MPDAAIRIEVTVTGVTGNAVGQDGEPAGAFIRTIGIPGLVAAESPERCEELLDRLFHLTGKALVRLGMPLTSAYLASRGVSHRVIADEPELGEGRIRREVALA